MNHAGPASCQSVEEQEQVAAGVSLISNETLMPSRPAIPNPTVTSRLQTMHQVALATSLREKASPVQELSRRNRKSYDSSLIEETVKPPIVDCRTYSLKVI